MVVPPAEPGATADLESPEAGGTRKLLLDEMQAERERAPLPPAPVLTLHPVPVDAAPVGAGRRGALKRLAEVEALARNNLRAAEEARRAMEAERALLEEEASARTQAERTAAALRRELERLRSTEEQRAAQARFAATHQAQTELATEMERVHDEHARVVDELDRMRGTLFDHDSLLDEYSQRLHDEQQAQAKARADMVRAEEAGRAAERNLEIALETGRRRAEDDHARLVKVEEDLRDAVMERDRATTELRSITTGDGELARLRVQAETTHEDMTRALADLDVQAARADKAETELATARETCSQAERAAAEAIEARDLAGIALETTRSELADRNELLDAERSTGQTRVADLTAQLGTSTRTAESATERAADLEARLATAIAARDDAAIHAEDLAEQLQHAVADAEQLRKHAATIGDELGATHGTLEQSHHELDDLKHQLDAARHELDITHRQLDEARRKLAAPSTGAADATDVGDAGESTPLAPALDDSAAGPSAFDAAVATAFGALTDPEGVEADEIDAESGSMSKSPASGFRTVEHKLGRRHPGGPVIEREAALVRQIAPVDPDPQEADAEAQNADDEAQDGETPAAPAWRRTAMAELTALAGDSDDLTPRRRR